MSVLPPFKIKMRIWKKEGRKIRKKKKKRKKEKKKKEKKKEKKRKEKKRPNLEGIVARTKG